MTLLTWCIIADVADWGSLVWYKSACKENAKLARPKHGTRTIACPFKTGTGGYIPTIHNTLSRSRSTGRRRTSRRRCGRPQLTGTGWNRTLPAVLDAMRPGYSRRWTQYRCPSFVLLMIRASWPCADHRKQLALRS
jgi:hypothetical protein